MNKFMITVLFTLTVLLIVQVSPANAGTWDTFKDSMGLQIIAYAIGAVVTLTGLTKWTSVTSRILLAIGALCTQLGVAWGDEKYTKEELADTIQKVKDVLAAVKIKKLNGSS